MKQFKYIEILVYVIDHITVIFNIIIFANIRDLREHYFVVAGDKSNHS